MRVKLPHNLFRRQLDVLVANETFYGELLAPLRLPLEDTTFKPVDFILAKQLETVRLRLPDNLLIIFRFSFDLLASSVILQSMFNSCKDFGYVSLALRFGWIGKCGKSLAPVLVHAPHERHKAFVTFAVLRFFK